MSTAITVLIWLVAVGVGLWILGSIIGAIFGAFMYKKINKEFKDFDNSFPSLRNKRF